MQRPMRALQKHLNALLTLRRNFRAYRGHDLIRHVELIRWHVVLLRNASTVLSARRRLSQRIGNGAQSIAVLLDECR
jgi:hypothetical protein